MTGELTQSTFDAPATQPTLGLDIRGDVNNLWTRMARSRTGRVAVGALSAVGLASCSTESDSPIATSTWSFTTPEDRIAAAIYYQPRTEDLHDSRSLEVPPVATHTMVAEPGLANSWTSEATKCNPENANNFTENEMTDKAHTLVGFSLGRLGVPYFLEQGIPEQQDAIDTIIIIAPGNKEDFTDSCDDLTNTSQLLNGWLQRGGDKRLVILGDNRSAENGFAGVRELYLDGLTEGVVDQVAVCATNMGHEETWNARKEAVFAKPPLQGCSVDDTPFNDWR